MTVTTTIFIVRNPAMTPSEFKEYYENKHVPFLQSVLGKDDFPLSHVRRYIARGGADGADGADDKPTLFFGSPALFGFDAYTEVTYRDQEHAQRSTAKYWANHDVISKDEDAFIDRDKLVIVGFEPALKTEG